MKAISNHEIIDLEDFKLTQSNRGFLYGDGLFETIAYVNGKPRLLSDHLQRIQKGAKLLKITWPYEFNLKTVVEDITTLAQSNSIPKDAIIRIHLWRESAGTYLPDQFSGCYLLTMRKNDFVQKRQVTRAGFAETCSNYYTKWSAIKSMSALNYVMAGIEKKERGLGEIIILNNQGFVSEALTSNVFWRKGNSYFTPPLSTGCIEGVMRNWFISALAKKGFHIMEKQAMKEELLNAECIFTTNAAGITHIKTIENSTFAIDKTAQDLMESIS